MSESDPVTAAQARQLERGLGRISKIERQLFAGGAPRVSTGSLHVSWADVHSHGVDTVISLLHKDTGELPRDLRCESFPVIDSRNIKESGATLKYLDKVVARLERLQSEGRVLYVHCLSGVSRTGMVLVAWQMKRALMRRDEALAAVRIRRPCVEPNPAFMELLTRWELTLRR